MSAILQPDSKDSSSLDVDSKGDDHECVDPSGENVSYSDEDADSLFVQMSEVSVPVQSQKTILDEEGNSPKNSLSSEEDEFDKTKAYRDVMEYLTIGRGNRMLLILDQFGVSVS